jgi:hypothetical protein
MRAPGQSKPLGRAGLPVVLVGASRSRDSNPGPPVYKREKPANERVPDDTSVYVFRCRPWNPQLKLWSD